MRIHNNYNAKNHFKKGNANNANKIENINQNPNSQCLTQIKVLNLMLMLMEAQTKTTNLD